MPLIARYGVGRIPSRCFKHSKVILETLKVIAKTFLLSQRPIATILAPTFQK